MVPKVERFGREQTSDGRGSNQSRLLLVVYELKAPDASTQEVAPVVVEKF